ncbi:MAG: YdcF family protein [Clostridiales bacterium]|nr:YdcF family protein [Clostridiales bacterium]
MLISAIAKSLRMYYNGVRIIDIEVNMYTLDMKITSHPQRYRRALIISGSRVMCRRGILSSPQGMPKIARRVISVLSALLLLNGLYCVFVLSPNWAYLLPGILGVVLVLFLLFERSVLLFLTTGKGRATALVICSMIGLNLLIFLVFVSLNVATRALVPDQGLDAVIVLGAGLRGSKLSPTLQARLDKSLGYIKDNPATIVVVTGGQGPGETVPEAQAMARYLIANDIENDRIIEESSSTSTEENFLYSRELLNDRFGGTNYRSLVVTNTFHIYRSAQYAKKAGLDVQVLAAPTKPFYLAPNNYIREYIAVVYYWVANR